MEPITRREMYLAAAAGYDVDPPEPITREEVFLAKLAGMDVETPVPYTRRERFIEEAAVAANKAVIEPLTVTENGTYTAPAGVDGYNPVTVAVAGGSSADVRYVTFMSYDGLVEYGRKAVAVGDDCADPIARGIFATPTRESDAQYNYTFYGWATEPNGAADANWNKAVTEDKTVYANFASAVRYYTITYYDSDGTTVLKTESLAYGSMPSYRPTREEFNFDGWEPDAAAVTGDASYIATWREKTERLIFLSKATPSAAVGSFAIANDGQKVVAAPSGSSGNIFTYDTTQATPSESKKTLYNGYCAGNVNINYSGTTARVLKYQNSSSITSRYLITVPLSGTASSSHIGYSSALACSPSTDLYCYIKNNNGSYSLVFSSGTSINIPNDGADPIITKDNKYLLYRDYNGTIWVIDISAKRSVATINTNVSAAQMLDVSADGTKCVISGNGGVFAEVYSLETFSKICDFSNILTEGSKAVFTNDMLVIASGSSIRAFDIVDSTPVETFDIPVYSGGVATKVASSHNKNYVAIYNGTNIELWGKS